MLYELRQLSANDGEDIYQMLQDIPKEEQGFINLAYGLTYEDYQKYLCSCVDASKGNNHGFLAQTTFWLYVDGSPVGTGVITHGLTPMTRLCGGNISYSIVARKRQKGYGALLLCELLKKASDLQIGDILITIKKTNEASYRTAEHCGCVRIKETADWYYYTY